ncbi:hypothetical protein [Acinetobacter zhairhuonensis]|uniref:hypothetical protein n=1 Tax=Acinetobacter sp. A7.4 TaxID=2919921 RepID=UPI001F4E4A56|nr:hypothetical protein [Acinetobacter sp. A7.4]MCJ8160399.1 hypothetical protein [Acinetobacter sp. A7.4]
MNKKSLNWAIAVTVIWLGVIGLIWILGSLKSAESLNELGDFLAGIFAPIAFFWLILGYIQQGKQLDQNTRALEQQEKALKLQIDEMRASVKLQGELSKIQKQQFDAMNHSAMPNLSIDSCSCEKYSINEAKSGELKLMLKIHKRGIGEALHIEINIKNKVFPVISKLKVDEATLETTYFNSELSDLSVDSKFMTVPITLIYKTKFNSQISENYLLKAFFIKNSWEIESSFIIRQ